MQHSPGIEIQRRAELIEGIPQDFRGGLVHLAEIGPKHRQILLVVEPVAFHGKLMVGPGLEVRLEALDLFPCRKRTCRAVMP